MVGKNAEKKRTSRGKGHAQARLNKSMQLGKNPTTQQSENKDSGDGVVIWPLGKKKKTYMRGLGKKFKKKPVKTELAPST